MDKVIYLFRKVGGEMRIESIEEKAKDTIEKYSFNEFPIDPVKIALKVGIAVRDVQFKDIAEDSVCGGILKENESIEIYVNKYDPINRKRFTIAHELGHYFDEKHQFSSSKQFTKLYKKYRTLFNQKTKKEYFAECFKEYVGGHQEKVKPFHSYMKTITQKIRQKNKWAMQKAWLMNKKTI